MVPPQRSPELLRAAVEVPGERRHVLHGRRVGDAAAEDRVLTREYDGLELRDLILLRLNRRDGQEGDEWCKHGLDDSPHHGTPCPMPGR